MNKTYDETVKYDKDLHSKYKADFIDNLKVYNCSLKKFDSCEHWGWNEEGENNLPFSDFGRIADFNFDISKTQTIFYYGDAPRLGYYNDNPGQLILLPGCVQYFKDTNRKQFTT